MADIGQLIVSGKHQGAFRQDEQFCFNVQNQFLRFFLFFRFGRSPGPADGSIEQSIPAEKPAVDKITNTAGAVSRGGDDLNSKTHIKMFFSRKIFFRFIDRVFFSKKLRIRLMGRNRGVIEVAIVTIGGGRNVYIREGYAPTTGAYCLP